jgi:hypothetical protein
MTRTIAVVRRVLIAAFLLVPHAALAQSAIAGVVKDSSGAVLPGVTVEVASPALIEKVRSSITDDRGAYSVVDLRPGVYTITFTLPGFSTAKRENLELPSDFTATVNGELRVGALEETVTVSGASPVVDVQSTAKAQVITRDMLDSIPTAHTAQTVAALVSGVIMGTPDVGGSGAMNQNATTAHGFNSAQTTVLLDGIQLNGMCGNGATQSYSNTQNYEEITVTNAGAGADVSAGGVRQNLVPRRGGNEFHGSGAAIYSSGDWQAAAVTPELAARGLKEGDSFDSLYTFETGFGGKFIKDRLWWFGGARKQASNVKVADTFYPDGRQGVNEQYIKNVSLRLTWQVNSKNQINAYHDRVFKYLGHDMSAGYEPQAAMLTLPSPLYEQGQVKWTSTVTSRLLLEVGFNQYQAYRTNVYQDGVEAPYGTADWYARATRRDTSLGTVRTAYPMTNSIQDPTRRFLQASATYATGSHNIKAGIQQNWGYEWFALYKNADLEQNYQNGTPTAVVVFNTPVVWNNSLDANVGAYAQDSWVVKRLTLNYGLRWEYFKASIPEETSTPGRFGPATNRSFGPQTFPIWKGFTPRFGVVYDLFGNAKTALKGSVNKYYAQMTDGLTNAYNPMRAQSATLSWTDLNGDDVAQGERGCVYQTAGCEINFAQLPSTFGQIAPGCSVLRTDGSTPCGTAQLDADRTREYTWLYSVGIQHELLPRVSVSANWFHSNFYNQGVIYNALQSFADYTPFTVASPIDGSPITMYNVSSAARSRVLTLETNATDRRRWNTAFEFNFNARLPHSATLFGGISTDRTLLVACDDPSNPNNQLYCDQTQNDIPWLTQFKLAGSVPLKWGVNLGAAYQSYRYILTGGTVWQITPTTRYAADCRGACTPGALVDPGMTVASLNVPLEPPGRNLSDRIKQLDITVGKWVTFGKVRVQPEVAVLNALNNHAVYAVRSQNYGTSSYMQPSTTLQPRILRLGMQVKW